MSFTPDPEHKLTAERFAEFREALEALYIPGNISGRLHFAQEWPVAALYVFGAALADFDCDGAPDRARRAVLEEEAEARQQALLVLCDEFKERSVDKGVLQVEYVRGVIDRLGRDLALHLYAPRVVDKITPPVPESGAGMLSAESE